MNADVCDHATAGALAYIIRVGAGFVVVESNADLDHLVVLIITWLSHLFVPALW